MTTSFINHASRIQLPDGCKLAINMKKDNHCHFSDFLSFLFFRVVLCVVVITTAQLQSSKTELRFCTGSNSVCDLPEIQDGEDLQQCSWLEIRLNTFRWSTIPQKQFIIIIIITSSSKVWCCHASLVKFIYWYKFHVNIMTGSGIMTIFVYKGLTRNPEIRNTHLEICPISGDWGKLGILNLAQTPFIKSHWMLQNDRVTAFIVAELLRGIQHECG